MTFNTKNFTPNEFTSSWSYLTDEEGQPCFGEIELFDDHVVCSSTEKKFSLHILVEVEAFGKVMMQTSVVTASNQSMDLLEALIAGKTDQIKKELINTVKARKAISSEKFQTISQQSNSHEKLSALVYFGENLAIENANEALEKRINNGETKDFLIGGQAFGIDKGEKYKKLHRENFDMGVAPFYFCFVKPESREKTNWDLTDRVVDFLVKTKRPIKGHPLVWFHIGAKPQWMEGMTFEEVKAFVHEHVPTVINRYKDRIKMWDIMNEVPSIDANSFDFTVDQLLEITKLVSDVVKRLQPDAERILNISDIFGPHSYVHDKPSIPPIHFLKLCEEKGIEYESIGLQFYMGMRKEFACRELLDISQAVDAFTQFGKPIHFSELGWPSQHDVDPDSFFGADHPEVAGRWHRGWDEDLQAEFAKAIYTIFASKPLAKSITWWDMTDNGKHQDIGSRFIPFGGLMRRDFSPKPILQTIQKFRERLRVAFA